MTELPTVTYRAAAAISRSANARPVNPEPSLPLESWEECRRLWRLLAKARRRGLWMAHLKLQRTLHDSISRCCTQLGTCRSLLELSPPPITAHEVLADLKALSAEFTEVKVSMRDHSVSAITDEIILDDINLGSFRIVLDWRVLHETGAYEVISEDGNAAASSEDTTHPHVQNNSLCEGEGKTAIRNALSEGRLFDFFVLVRQILQTYNPSSAYVQLEDWYGTSCPDCGSTTCEDESSTCENCSTTTCFECSNRCNDCDYRYCSDCIRTCTGCDSDACLSCRSRCRECGDGFCKGCIDNGRCLSCLETEKEEAKQTALV